jgi:hypothetical protein
MRITERNKTEGQWSSNAIPFHRSVRSRSNVLAFCCSAFMKLRAQRAFRKVLSAGMLC